jgi:hypothetical protein
MGFFSENCQHCGHPALSAFAIDSTNAWMNDVVAITPNGSVIRGEYDGYGSVGYHFACWDQLGRPTDYKGPSEDSSDQGWFFDDGAHSFATPDEAKAHENPEAPWRQAMSEQGTQAGLERAFESEQSRAVPKEADGPGL